MGGGYDARSFKLMEQHLIRHSAISAPLLLQQKWRKRFNVFSRFRRKQRQQQIQSPFDALPPSEGYNLECYELDLPDVVRAKRKLIQSRLSRRRPWLLSNDNARAAKCPTLMEVDLNNLNATQTALQDILNGGTDNPEKTANIILFEGVMIYLDRGIPHALLKLCSDVLYNNTQPLNGKDTGTILSNTSNYLVFADRLENIPGGDEAPARKEMNETGWELVDWLSKPGLARHMGVASLKRRSTEPFA